MGIFVLKSVHLLGMLCLWKLVKKHSCTSFDAQRFVQNIVALFWADYPDNLDVRELIAHMSLQYSTSISPCFFGIDLTQMC